MTILNLSKQLFNGYGIIWNHQMRLLGIFTDHIYRPFLLLLRQILCYRPNATLTVHMQIREKLFFLLSIHAPVNIVCLRHLFHFFVTGFAMF